MLTSPPESSHLPLPELASLMRKQVARLMKAKEIRDLNATEMEQKIAGLKEELFNLRFQIATGQLENPMRIREVKKAIARIKTIQRESEIKAQRA